MIEAKFVKILIFGKISIVRDDKTSSKYQLVTSFIGK